MILFFLFISSFISWLIGILIYKLSYTVEKERPVYYDIILIAAGSFIYLFFYSMGIEEYICSKSIARKCYILNKMCENVSIPNHSYTS